MRAIYSSLRRSLFHCSSPYPYFSGESGGGGGTHRRFFHLNQAAVSSLQLPKDLLALVSSLSENPNNPKILRDIDSILLRSHLLDSTTSVFLLRGLARSRKITRAKILLSSLKQRAKIPDPFLYSIVLQCLLPHNPIRDVELVWNEISGDHSASGAASFVVHFCRRCDDALDVVPLCRRILSCRWAISCEGYAAMISALCLKKNPNPALARDVLKEMLELGLKVDDLSYYSVFRSFCKAGDPSGADSVMRIMGEKRIHDMHYLIYADFVYSLCKAGKFREARKLFDKMSKRDERRNEHIEQLGTTPKSPLKPGRRIIFQLSSSKLISKAMAFEAYFRALCSSGRLEDAEILLKEAAEKHVEHEVCVQKSFINALFCSGRHAEAIRFFEAEKKKKKKKKNRYVYVNEFADSVISSLCKIGRVEESHQLLRQLVNEGFFPTASIWNAVMESYCEVGRVDEAMGIFEGLNSGDLGSSVRPDGSSFSIVIHQLLSRREVEKARNVVEEMVRRKFQAGVDLYCELVNSLQSCGRFEEANYYLNSMIESGVLVSYSQWEVMAELLIKGNCDP
ncbi:Protein Rf1, mitochondrial [Apostasia shenzhenica]|uniref:Protein Rf1, mitochondrial n=1 Tax=Apostasia shenzhenica TaxID=1088818 RepID=A0A2I0BCT9_9ASPA|nr:Protein Rf1, mitochondrial [Apostasia shenzhenica]